MGFGDSSLNFELRVWIRDFIGRRRIQSELNQAIDSRFRSEGIEIPFPQRDLHVRSVDETPGSILTPPGDQPPDLVVVSSKEKDEEED
jgi:small-conductance mechanosensitive channel